MPFDEDMFVVSELQDLSDCLLKLSDVRSVVCLKYPDVLTPVTLEVHLHTHINPETTKLLRFTVMPDIAS